MKKYAILEDILKREFGSVRGFARQAKIPHSTLFRLIKGAYGSEESKVMGRINDKLKRLKPDLSISRIWDPSYQWYQKYVQEKSVVRNGFRILVDVKLNEKGELTIAPALEGY
jgi:hypothetical protein